MPPVLVRVEEGVATVTLNRPEVLNAFDVETAAALRRAFDEVARDPKARAVVLTGAGSGFCAGGDVAAMRGALEKDPQALIARLTEEFHAALLAIRRMEKPVVAAVNGVAAGGGLGLALCCDVRIASPRAKFKPAYFRIGIAPDGGMTYFLPRIVGLARAQAMALDDAVVDAETALAWGLVSRVVPAERLLAEAAAAAQRYARGPAFPIGRTKALLNQSILAGLEPHLEAERRGTIESAGTADFREGVRSFFEKRAPRFGTGIK